MNTVLVVDDDTDNVEEDGGRLSVSFQPGEGTQVTVWLPLAAETATFSVC